jgi:3-oxoacyl-[acyl-carrier-protein] synthase II
MEKRRVVVTGMGAVAPNGIGVERFWESLVHGHSAVRKITRFDASSYASPIAAEVPDFDPTGYMDPKTAKRLSRFAQFALVAAQMAVKDSSIDFSREDPHRVGVFVGTAIGGLDLFEIQHSVFMEKGIKRINPYSVASCSTHSASAVIACEFNLKGINTTVSAGCNTGLDTAYLAYNSIRLGDADMILVGAGEAPLTPLIHGIFCATGQMAHGNGEPQRALRPYDVDADGVVLGEGGACIVIEELRHALRRNARVYGEIISYSALNEAFELFEVDNNEETMALNLKQVLERGHVDAREIDYINAHGNGIKSYDVTETKAIKRVFGELAYHIPVASIKPVTGHSISTTSVLQMITSLLAMKYDMIPPTINLENPAPGCDLNYVPNHFLRKEVRTVLINVHGFGGRLTTMIMRKFLAERTAFL